MKPLLDIHSFSYLSAVLMAMITRKIIKCWSCLNQRHHSVDYILRQQKAIGEKINVKGWVHSQRALKNVTFLGINDGSCVENLQVVVHSDCMQFPVAATYGTSVNISGVVQESSGSNQDIDVVADRVDVLGQCQQKNYPYKYKKSHTPEHIRQHLHLRSKTRSFGSLLRVRNAITQSIHQTLQTDDYIQIDTPILTSNDCEGAGEIFQVEPADKKLLQNIAEEDGVGLKEHFFGTPVYLTVSGQLHLEAIASGMKKVYTLGPTFRAENSRGRHHLAEFYMLEAELSFVEDLESLLKNMESTVKGVVQRALTRAEDDMNWHWQKTKEASNQKELVEKLVTSDYVRMSYDEAVKVLSENSEKFTFHPKWGHDLQKEHERFLVTYCNNVPVFVTDFPADIKPFYMRCNADNKTVAAVDLLVPGVGELCGGSLRETDTGELEERLQRIGAQHALDWYLDLRRFGSVDHGGYGLGVERLIMAVTGIQNIRDVIPFPRSPSSCKL